MIGELLMKLNYRPFTNFVFGNGQKKNSLLNG